MKKALRASGDRLFPRATDTFVTERNSLLSTDGKAHAGPHARALGARGRVHFVRAACMCVCLCAVLFTSLL